MKRILLYGLSAAMTLVGCNTNDDPIPGNEAEIDGYRPVTASSSAFQTRVYDYRPAPGQFINETVIGGFTGQETTPAAANEYALNRLAAQKTVSLGAFGGYIVVGFDHSILNSGGGYDFAIKGNATESSNEPGVVWVMQDSNGNGQPDDVWYELQGSETGASSTVKGYSVTYYRPAGAKEDVRWTDSQGNTGAVAYMGAYHKQDSYYPAWIAEESYTLTGTRLEARNECDPLTGDWINRPFGWGYADNQGSDMLASDQMWVGFKISNAINDAGKKVTLHHIDFVKVQQGVMAQSGRLGENSCEVCAVADYSLLAK